MHLATVVPSEAMKLCHKVLTRLVETGTYDVASASDALSACASVICQQQSAERLELYHSPTLNSRPI